MLCPRGTCFPLSQTKKKNKKVKKMKTRMIGIVMTLALVAWLPTAAQQNPAPPAAAQQAQAQGAPADSAKSADKCACCQPKAEQDKGSAASKTMACCEGKEMACCKKEGKDQQHTAMNCCSGKGAKQCSAKKGKDCCGKDAMACNGSKDGKNCCAGHTMCSHSNSQS